MNIITKTFNGQPIGIIEHDGTAWLAAKDITKTLGYTNSSKVIHCLSPANVKRINHAVIINQAGVRELAARGRKRYASQFNQWANKEVFGKVQPIVVPVCNPPVASSDCPLGAIIQLLQQMQRDGCCQCKSALGKTL